MLKELQDATRLFRLQSWEIPVAGPAQLSQRLGVRWPMKSGTIANGVGAQVLSLGTTDWWVVLSPLSAPRPEMSLEAYQEDPFRVTELSDAIARFDLSGERAEELLAKGCSLDLHVGHFPVSHCVRTRLASMPVVLWRQERARFQCWVAASLATHFVSWVEDASLSGQGTLLKQSEASAGWQHSP